MNTSGEEKRNFTPCINKKKGIVYESYYSRTKEG